MYSTEGLTCPWCKDFEAEQLYLGTDGIMGCQWCGCVWDCYSHEIRKNGTMSKVSGVIRPSTITEEECQKVHELLLDYKGSLPELMHVH